MSAETAPHAASPAARTARPAPHLRLAVQAPLEPRRRGLVERPRLLLPLLDARPRVALVVGPAGYGKSELVADWEAHDPRPFAWVRLTADEDEPSRLLASIADALDGRRPAVLVLDDLHVVRSAPAQAVVAELADDPPAGVTLVLVSRSEPVLSLARLRADDAVSETRTAQLAMTATEAAAALRHAGLRLAPAQLGRVMQLTEGWPAAVRLVGRVLREQSDVATALDALGGDDSVIAGYLRDEVLAALTPEDRTFLRRASVLDRLCGAVCDAVTGDRGAGPRLRHLADANALVLPLDRAGLAFRLHPLCAQALRAELRCVEPELEPELHRRASDWSAGERDVERAVEHAVAAGDVARVERLLLRWAPPYLAGGRAALVDRWIGALGDEAVAERPALAVIAGAARLARGDRDGAERWAHGACTDRTAGGVAALRAAIARAGVEQMVRDAETASATATESRLSHAVACLLSGAGHCLAGDTPVGRARLDDGARAAGPTAPLIAELCLALRAFAELQDGDVADAAATAATARRSLTDRDAHDDPATALTFAVSAATLARSGATDRARDDADRALGLLAAMAAPPPWYAVCVELAAALAELRLSDGRAARELLDRAGRRRRDLPDAAGLHTWIDDAWARADDLVAGAVAAPSALTLAELRILRLLPTHLAFREIAARLHVSANTVKTQAHAVYRKLDATSRSEAVDRARQIGLLDR
jgi:LuxR family maltose regulon positive regulatory protein